MGGAPESILVYRLSLDSKLGKTLGKFDALKAKCYYSRDREKLLAVVEAGFGDVRPFNKQVRHILDANVEATSAALPMAAAVEPSDARTTPSEPKAQRSAPVGAPGADNNRRQQDTYADDGQHGCCRGRTEQHCAVASAKIIVNDPRQRCRVGLGIETDDRLENPEIVH